MQPVRKIIYMCVVNVGQMFSRIHAEEEIYFLMGIISLREHNFIPQLFLKSLPLPWVPETCLARFPVSVKSV